jgi:hypothetical protein
MRNIFIANDEKLNELDDEYIKSAMSCWVYSYHDSAKEFESFRLELKAKYRNEEIYITKANKKHDKKEVVGYMGMYEDGMIKDIYNFFIQNYKDTTISSLLNGNNELICKRDKMIKIGETSEDLQKLEQEKITITHKVTNQIQLNKEFNG